MNTSQIKSMTKADLKRWISDLVDDLTELRTQVNALRVDFRAHDHGATYGAAATRLNALANTFSGTAETSAAAAALKMVK